LVNIVLSRNRSPKLKEHKSLFMKIKITYTQLILYITWLYSVQFIGAFPKNLNSLISILIVFLPSIIAWYLIKLFKHKEIQFTFKLNRLFIVLFGVIIYLLLNFRNGNLFSDEVAYASGSFKLARGIHVLLIDIFPLVKIIRVDIVLQILTLIIFIIPIYFIFFNKKFNKQTNIVLILIIVFRFILAFILKEHVGVYPPMPYFITSLFTSIFGLTTFNLKVAQIIPLFLIILIICEKYNFSYLKTLILLIIISVDPFIGYFHLYVEQANYTTLFGALIFFLLLDEKINVRQISLIIGISVLFRSSTIAFILVPIIAHFKIHRKFNIDFLKNLSPLLIGFPVFFIALIQGTPTTPDVTQLHFGGSIFNKLNELELVTNSYNILDYLLIPFFLTFVILIYKKRWHLFFSILSFLFLYIIIHFISHSPRFEQKYYYELYGSSILFFYILMIIYLKIDNVKYRSLIIVGSLSFFIILSYTYKHNKSKNLTNYHTKNKNFNPIQNLNNDRIALFKLFQNNLQETIFIDIYYGNFPFILDKNTQNQLTFKNKISKEYHSLQISPWLEIDTSAINKLNTKIRYIILIDGLEEINKEEIQYLLNNGWIVHMKKELSRNSLGWLILKNSKKD
jgi:hypothetical protein